MPRLVRVVIRPGVLTKVGPGQVPASAGDTDAEATREQATNTARRPPEMGSR